MISRDRLSRLVLIENTGMSDLSIIQWDKNDIDSFGLLKIDVLALGMLSTIRSSLDLIANKRNTPFELQDIPAKDTMTYEMVCKADTVGVFQIESRAQMSMLSRLQPRCFYDLMVEMALVSPDTAKGVMFVMLEDKIGQINVIVWPALLEPQRNAALNAALLAGIWRVAAKRQGGRQASCRFVSSARHIEYEKPQLSLMESTLEQTVGTINSPRFIFPPN